MPKTLSNVLRYWRTALADGALGEGTFRAADRKRFMVLPNDALQTGNLPKQLVQSLFQGKEGSGTVSVRFWPLVTARKASHAAARADGIDMPICDTVARLVAGETRVADAIQALLSRPLRSEGR